MSSENQSIEKRNSSAVADSGAADEGVIQVVSFQLKNEEFAVPILKVQEIIRSPEVTRVPKTPDFVEGIINLRGRVVPLISLRKRFGLEHIAIDHNTRVIVVELQGKVVGFSVDGVREVIRVQTSVIEPPPALIGGIEKEFLSGVAKLEERLLILLDLDKVLSNNEVEQLQEAA